MPDHWLGWYICEDKKGRGKEMKNKKNGLNKFELLWSGYAEITWANRAMMDAELENNYGNYSVSNGQYHMSYGKKFRNETKREIIVDFISNDFCLDLLLPEGADTTKVLFGFREIRRSSEIKALQALVSIGTHSEPYYWEHWLWVNGTILNPKETQDYLRSTGGIASYISRNTKYALNESGGIS